jgi:hypothetical protein
VRKSLGGKGNERGEEDVAQFSGVSTDTGKKDATEIVQEVAYVPKSYLYPFQEPQKN